MAIEILCNDFWDKYIKEKNKIIEKILESSNSIFCATWTETFSFVKGLFRGLDNEFCTEPV